MKGFCPNFIIFTERMVIADEQAGNENPRHRARAAARFVGNHRVLRAPREHRTDDGRGGKLRRGAREGHRGTAQRHLRPLQRHPPLARRRPPDPAQRDGGKRRRAGVHDAAVRRRERQAHLRARRAGRRDHRCLHLLQSRSDEEGTAERPDLRPRQGKERLHVLGCVPLLVEGAS